MKRSRRGRLRALTINDRRRKFERNLRRRRLLCPAIHDGAPCRQRLYVTFADKIWRCTRRHYEVADEVLVCNTSGRMP